MQRRKVLLPEPDDPRIEITSPSLAVSEMPFSTSSEPKRLRMSLTVRAGVSAGMLRSPSARPRAQVRRQAPLEPEERGADDIVDGEVDRACKDQRQVGDERVVADFQRHAQHVPERDE